MADIRIAPASLDDVLAYAGALPFTRARVWAAWVDGEIKGVGGIAALPNGVVMAFLDLDDEVRQKAGFAMARRVKRGLDETMARGVKQVTAIAQQNVPGSERFLEWLGFSLVNADTRTFIYEA